MRGNNLAKQWHFSAELFKRFVPQRSTAPALHRTGR
jgi:hypothetical protein